MKRDRILVFGCNSMVIEVARQLREKEHDITIVSQDEECIHRIEKKHIHFKNVDYTDDEALKSLGIGQDVGVIFSFFKKDAKNVYLTISAKNIDPDILIITLSQSLDSSDKLRAAGADKVIDPYEISGRKIYNMIRRPLVSETIEQALFSQTLINIAEITIKENCFLDGKRLGQSHLSQNYNLILLGVVDKELGNEFIFKLSGINHKLDTNDLLVVIGTTEEIERLRKDINTPV